VVDDVRCMGAAALEGAGVGVAGVAPLIRFEVGFEVWWWGGATRDGVRGEGYMCGGGGSGGRYTRILEDGILRRWRSDTDVLPPVLPLLLLGAVEEEEDADAAAVVEEDATAAAAVVELPLVGSDGALL